jgi:hypothetical protein
MTDSAPTPPAVPAPTPAAPADPAAPTSSDLKPGYKTSEAWITFLTILLGAIPSSGLTTDAPLLAKIVGMAIAALAALNYTAQRTALKRAYAVRSAATIPSSKTPLVAGSAIVALVVALGVTYGGGCAGSAGTSVGAGSSAATGGAFLQCGKQDLTQLVGPKGLTLLAQVYADLSSGDYAQLVADLITIVGNDAVGCAVLALESLDKASGSGSGSGSGVTAAPLALTMQSTRARELIEKYHWQLSRAAK